MAESFSEHWTQVAVASVSVIHAKRVGTNDYMAPHEYAWCVECRQVWPCTTIAAIEASRPTDMRRS